MSFDVVKEWADLVKCRPVDLLGSFARRLRVIELKIRESERKGEATLATADPARSSPPSPTSSRPSAATERALKLIAKGMTPYAAANKVGIALSTIYRALKRNASHAEKDK